MRMGATLKAKAVQVEIKGRGEGSRCRQGSLEHLGLGDCQLTGGSHGPARYYGFMLCLRAHQKIDPLDSNNALSDEAVRSLANALDRSKPTPIKTMVLRGQRVRRQALARPPHARE